MDASVEAENEPEHENEPETSPAEWVIKNLHLNPDYENRLPYYKEKFPELFSESQAFWGMIGPQKIEQFQMYTRKDRTGLTAVLHLGSSIHGFPGVVHGGFTAMAFDEMFGWSVHLSGLKSCFTAYIKIDYKKPVMCNETYLLHTEVHEIAGRKALVKGSLKSVCGETFAEAEGLFVKPKGAP